MAIEGETYEYTEMYPTFESKAIREGNYEIAKEAKLQAEESKEHAEQFIAVLKKAEKRFAALKKIEERHANAYKEKLENL
jgi:rubrerythrin